MSSTHCVNINSKEVAEIANSLGIHQAVASAKIGVWQTRNNTDAFPTVSELINSTDVSFILKAVDILASDKAKQVFEKSKKNNWDLNKILTELQVPKEQKQIILDKNITDREEIITSLLAENSFVVEVNTTKENLKPIVKQENITKEIFESINVEPEFDGDPESYSYIKETPEAIYYASFNSEGEEYYTKSIKGEQNNNSSHYSNLTVPGGTNYTENEIATPAITPSIKGHAQFATDNGIGWFRSDEKSITNLNNVKKLDKEFLDSLSPAERDIVGEEDWQGVNQNISTKTRRILEVQSDLFQKGRGKNDLVSNNQDFKSGETPIIEITNPIIDKATEEEYLEAMPYNKGIKLSIEPFSVKGSGRTSFYELGNYFYFEGRALAKYKVLKSNLKLDEIDKTPNKFLQLLNKDSNWVSFFIKSIIQDSQKKGYEKILFPNGNTASKVEGHSTLEEFKKEKENRIKVLEKALTGDINGLSQNEAVGFYGADFSKDGDIAINNEINQLKQELKRVETEGFAALRPIYNFYENTVTNILNKTYGKDNVNLITDEYGNTWNEIELEVKRDSQNILLQQPSENNVNAQANPETIKKVKDFLKRIGVNIETTKEIVFEGRKLDANAIANITQSLIQVVEGKESSALPEEAMHFAVELIEQTDKKLFAKLMKEVNGFQILKDVYTEYGSNPLYQTKEGKPDILKLKKEAIGKILAEVIINKSEGMSDSLERVALAQGWWSQIKEFLQKLFNKSGFDQAAMDVLSGKNIGQASDLSSEESYLQQAPKSKQDTIYDSVVDLSKSIELTEDGYTINGKAISRRVSDIVKDWYSNRFADQSLVEDEFTVGINDLKAQNGTKGHADFEQIFSLYVDETTGLLRDTPLTDPNYVSQLNPANNIMYDALHDNLFARLHSFPAGTKFMSEIRIYDKARDLAGTVDFVAITPEGKVSILDWKFMDLKTDKYDDIPWFKISAWNKQMEQYKYIMSKVYSIKPVDFVQTRMIPIKANYTEANYKTGVMPVLVSIKIGAVDPKNIVDDYLIPVGLEEEKTGDRKIDALIEKLNAIYKKISSEKVTPDTKEAKAEQLNSLFYAIRQLQMKQNIAPLVSQARILNKQVDVIVETYKTQFKGKPKTDFTNQQISDFAEKIEQARQSIAVYSSLDTDLKYLFSDATPEDRQLKEDIRDVADNAREAEDILGNKDDGIDAEFITSFIGSTATPEKVIRGITKLFGNTATIQLKGLETLFKKANRAFDSIGKDVNDEVKNLARIKASYQIWAKGKGLSISNQFEMIMKPGNNELLDQYDPVFYAKLKQKITEKDFEWIRDNVDKDLYKAHLKEKLENEHIRIDNKPRDGTDFEMSIQISREKAKVDAIYNISTPTSPGWLLYNEVKGFPVNTWETAKWKTLQQPENAPALAFYDYIIGRNKLYTEIGYINAKQSRVFLPWVRKSFYEKVIFGGNVTIGEQFLRNISLDDKDTGYGQVDPLTGKPINVVPKYLTSAITDGESSTDLFKNMAMYNEFALKFKYLSEIEAQGRALIRLEKNKGSIATSYFGKTDRKDGAIAVNPDNTENTKLVEDMVKAIIYQQRYIQSDSFDQLLTTIGNTSSKINAKLGFKLFPEDMDGRQVSVNKIISQMNNNFQVMTLGLNPLSALSNLFGGTANAYINSGKYFTKADFTKTSLWLMSNKMFGSDKKKMLAALDYFIPFTDNYNRDAGKNLSLNKLTDEHIQDFLMWMMRNSEEAVQKITFFTFLNNSAVVNGSVVNTREYLKTTPEFIDMYAGTQEERTARNDAFEKAVIALNESSGIMKLGVEKDGVFSIPGIERKDESVVTLRRKVQQFTSDALGNLTEENKRLVNLNVYGKSFMVFKNWIPRLVDVRMGDLKYNAGSDAYEWGRMRMLYTVISQDLLGSISNLSNTLKANDKGIEFLRKLYETKKATYEEETGKELEMTESEFLDLVRQNTKNQITDLLFYGTLMALTLGIKALPPDDDEDPAVRNAHKFLLKATDKLTDEIGYFYDPTSLTSLVSSGVFPSIRLLENYKKALSKFLVETYAISTGNEELEDKTYVIKYWLKSFKFTNQLQQMMPMFAPDVAKDLGIKMQSQYGVR